MQSSKQRQFPFVALIPAYNPSNSLVVLAGELIQRGVEEIVVVDDGSGQESQAVFRALENLPQCSILHHAVNLGKGRALKTGFNHIYLHYRHRSGVVTCDADGQHHPDDVVKLGAALSASPAALTIGCRSFGPEIPFRSLLGNVVTKYIFYFIVGRKLSDTQSGLRGIPMHLLPNLIRLEGEKYEYEMNMLLLTKNLRVNISETPISTIYLNNNASSHFNPLFDSMRIYFVLLRFGFTSLLTTIVDQFAFFLCYQSGLSIAHSMVFGRLVSSVFNLSMNKTFVFKSRAQMPGIILRFYTSIVIAASIAYGMINFLHGRFGWSVMQAKISVESLLFLASFVVNRDLVFTQKDSATSQ